MGDEMLFMALRGKLKSFYYFLKSKRAGDLVTVDEILNYTTWSFSTFETYLHKNHFRLFLTPSQDGRFRILKDGETLSQQEISEAFTQVRPGRLVLAPGTILNGGKDTYQLIERLGNGAVAHVWKAISRNTNGSVAAKIMYPREDLLEPTTLANVKRRFLREARNGQQVSHPNLVTYLDHGDLGEHPFLIMKLADCSIGKLLKERVLSPQEALKIIRQCLDGLAHLHSHRCVHRRACSCPRWAASLL